MENESLGKQTTVLTIRDLKLMSYLFENKVAAIEQISRDIFDGSHVTAARRRLNKLWKIGQVEKIPHFSEKRCRILYSLSPEGLRYLEKKNKNAGLQGKRKSDSINHDLTLIEIRNRLSQAEQVTRYLTENTLQSDSQYRADEVTRHAVELRCDGLLVYVRGEKRGWIPLEYEASAKSDSRYLNKLKDYYTRQEVSTVLFIAGNDAILKTVFALDQKFKDEFHLKLYFTTIKEVLTGNREVIFQSGLGKKLKFTFGH